MSDLRSNLSSSADGYSAEDVQRILAIAMEPSETFSDASLSEMAQELAIDDVTLQRAVQTWRVSSNQEKAQAEKLDAQRRRKQQFYRQSLLPYLAVNSFLVILNVSLCGAITWAIYPLLGWGLAVAMEAIAGPNHKNNGRRCCGWSSFFNATRSTIKSL